MITALSLFISINTYRHALFFSCEEILRSLLATFQIHNMVLLIMVTMLYVTALWLIYILNRYLCLSLFFDKYCCMWIWCLGQWQPPCDHEGRHHWHSKDGRAESGKHLGPSVQFTRSVVSDSLRSHASQHARPPCPSPTPGGYSNSYPSSW